MKEYSTSYGLKSISEMSKPGCYWNYSEFGLISGALVPVNNRPHPYAGIVGKIIRYEKGSVIALLSAESIAQAAAIHVKLPSCYWIPLANWMVEDKFDVKCNAWRLNAKSIEVLKTLDVALTRKSYC